MKALIRTFLRINRGYLLAWLIPLLGLMAAVVPIFVTSYGTAYDKLAAIIEPMRSSTAIIALYGRIPEPFTYGWVSVWEMGMWIPLLGGIMIALLAVKLSRGNEEAGRTEMVAVSGIRRRDPLRAAITVIVAVAIFMGVFSAASMSVQIHQLPNTSVAGCWYFGAGITLAISAFGVLGLLCAQLASTARSARFAALGTVAAAMVVRALADTSSAEWIRWLSPLGWRDEIRPFWGPRTWPLGVMALVVLSLCAVVMRLEKGRDLGAPARLPALFRKKKYGTTALEPTAAAARIGADEGLNLPALTWRIERTGALAWFIGICALVFFWTSSVGTIEQAMTQGDQKVDVALQAYAPSSQSVGAAFLQLITIFASLLVVSAVTQISLHALRDEEQGLTAHILSRGHTARQYLGANLMVSAVLLTLLATIGALCTSAIIRGGDLPALAEHGRWVLWGSLPPAIVCIGVVIALIALAPRAANLIWAVIAISGTLSILGPALKINDSIVGLSIFEYVPYQGNGNYRFTGALVMIAIGVLAGAIGIIRISRRDQLAG